MYVDMLTTALNGWESELCGSELVEYVIDCRKRLLVSGIGTSADADISLAAELAYDRALILLCRDLGIEVGPDGFASPFSERSRIEGVASAAGVDIAALSKERKRRRADRDDPSPDQPAARVGSPRSSA